MKVFSKTHTITAEAGAAVTPVLGVNGKPLPKTAVINHVAGTVLDLPDDSAEDLIARGTAEEYKPDEHKDEPDGVVSVTAIGQADLKDGQTQPNEKRQDGTLNDGQPARPVAPTVLRDSKNDAAVQAEREAELKAEQTRKASGAA